YSGLIIKIAGSKRFLMGINSFLPVIGMYPLGVLRTRCIIIYTPYFFKSGGSMHFFRLKVHIICAKFSRIDRQSGFFFGFFRFFPRYNLIGHLSGNDKYPGNDAITLPKSFIYKVTIYGLGFAVTRKIHRNTKGFIGFSGLIYVVEEVAEPLCS